MSTDNVAAALLARFRSRGVERLYVNAGTDFAPLVEAYAGLRRGVEDQFPRPVVAAHENLAMGMAHGAYLLTGRPQVVMFHVNVGTANAVCAAINAAAEQVPLVILAGRTPIFEKGVLGSRNTRVSWAQEMYDQAALVRECVKWEYELRDGAQVDDVVDRALTIAMTEPRGPVYLTLPREVLAREGTIGPAASAKPRPPTGSPPPTSRSSRRSRAAPSRPRSPRSPRSATASRSATSRSRRAT
jgi:acetolactate synthase I/II/III large subunit